MEHAKFTGSTDTVTSNPYPIRCLLWGTGNAFRDSYHIIKYYENIQKICVYGVTSNVPIYSELAGYRFISKDAINTSSFDVVIVMSYSKDLINEICSEAAALGINHWNIIPCSVIRQIGFDFEKYRELKKNPSYHFLSKLLGRNNISPIETSF